MQISRETRNLNIVCVGLVLLAGVIRLTVKGTGLFSYNSIIFALFAGAASIWIFQLHKRLLQKDVRRNLIGTALLIMLWMAIRTAKYEYLPSGHFTVRYAWYLYYIPMVLIPLLMFLSVLAIGKPHGKSIDRRWYLLFVPAAVIIAGVLTNDLHQMAFRFPDGLSHWNDYDMIRGVVYYVAITWMAFLFIAILAVVLVRCAVPERRKMIWLPLTPLLIGSVYSVCTVIDSRNLLIRMLTVPEMGCFIFAAFIECLICVRLFPNNDGYDVFWRSSSIGAGIMDKNGVVRYKSEMSIDVTQEQVVGAQNKSVLLENGRLCLKSHPIRCGFSYWICDISEIKRLNEELKKLGNVTAEENSMLEAENKMRAEHLHIEEQNRLYDDMARGVKKQLDILNELLDSPPEDEKEFEKTMRYACILNAYIKRHSNLLLLSHQSNVLFSEELRCAAVESMEYVKLFGINAHCTFDGKEKLSGKVAIFAYEFFEDVLEASVNVADNVLVYWQISKSSLILQMEINVQGEILPDIRMFDRAAAFGGTLETEAEGSTDHITLTLPSTLPSEEG